jgi:hypothetical protein
MGAHHDCARWPLGALPGLRLRSPQGPGRERSRRRAVDAPPRARWHAQPIRPARRGSARGGTGRAQSPERLALRGVQGDDLPECSRSSARVPRAGLRLAMRPSVVPRTKVAVAGSLRRGSREESPAARHDRAFEAPWPVDRRPGGSHARAARRDRRAQRSIQRSPTPSVCRGDRPLRLAARGSGAVAVAVAGWMGHSTSMLPSDCVIANMRHRALSWRFPNLIVL